MPSRCTAAGCFRWQGYGYEGYIRVYMGIIWSIMGLYRVIRIYVGFIEVLDYKSSKNTIGQG